MIPFPTPQVRGKSGRRQWEKFLHRHKLWRPQTAAARLAIFAQAEPFKASDPIVEAKRPLAVSLGQRRRTLDPPWAPDRQPIDARFPDPPDHDLLGSLPGAKKGLAPRRLAAMGPDPHRYGSPPGRQCFAGTAPVPYQSGQVPPAAPALGV